MCLGQKTIHLIRTELFDWFGHEEPFSSWYRSVRTPGDSARLQLSPVAADTPRNTHASIAKVKDVIFVCVFSQPVYQDLAVEMMDCSNPRVTYIAQEGVDIIVIEGVASTVVSSYVFMRKFKNLK